MPALSMATSVPVPMAMPTSACARAGASLIPSPAIATRRPSDWSFLITAFFYNAAGVPIAAGVLYPFFGLLLSPIIAALAMSLSSVSVITNALRLRVAKLG